MPSYHGHEGVSFRTRFEMGKYREEHDREVKQQQQRAQQQHRPRNQTVYNDWEPVAKDPRAMWKQIGAHTAR